MFLKLLLLGVCGLAFGILSSAGVFTVLSSVGLIPRFAGKMHVADRVFVLEEAVIFGAVTGGFISVFDARMNIGKWILSNRLLGAETEIIWRCFAVFFLLFAGFFAGMFVGCLALQLRKCWIPYLFFPGE